MCSKLYILPCCFCFLNHLAASRSTTNMKFTKIEKDDVFTYNDQFMPKSNEIITDECQVHNHRLIDRCVEAKRHYFNAAGDGPAYPFDLRLTKHTAFRTPYVFRGQRGEAQPLPKNPDVFNPEETPIYGLKPVNMHLFGRLPYIPLEFKTREDAKKYCSPVKLTEVIQRLCDTKVGDNGQKIRGVLGRKLVFKKPPTHASQGGKFFAKLVLGGNYSSPYVFVEAMKRMRDCPFVPEATHTVIKPPSEFLRWKNASVCGEMTIDDKGNAYDPQVLEKEHYDIGEVHYKDVKFRNRIHMKLTKNRYNRVVHYMRDVLEEELEKTTYAKALFAGKVERSLTWDHLVKLGLAEKEINADDIKTWFTDYIIGKYKHMDNTVEIGNLMYDIERQLGLPETDDISEFILEMVEFQYKIRAAVKYVWDVILYRDYMASNPSVDDERRALLSKIVKMQRRVAWDIETSFRKQTTAADAQEPQHLIAVHVTLYDEGAHTCPYEHKQFIWKPSFVKDHVYDEQRITEEVNKQLIDKRNGRPYNANFEMGKTFHVHEYSDEAQTIHEFLNYVRNTNAMSMTYFNGHSFDLPFVMYRVDAMKMIENSVKSKFRKKFVTGVGSDGYKRKFDISFTHMRDAASILYDRKDRGVNHKKNAVEKHLHEERVKEALRRFNENDEDEDADNFLCSNGITGNANVEAGDEEDVDMEVIFGNFKPKTEEEKTIYDPLLKSREISTLAFNYFGTVDIMKEVAGTAGMIKLDTAVKNVLGTEKFHCKEVDYDNLTDTWEKGDRDLLVIYCALDTILTALLDKKIQTSNYYMAMSDLTYLSPRELFGNESVKIVVNHWNTYAFPRSIYTPYMAVFRDEEYLHAPGFEFDKERDMPNLKPRAGVTVDGTWGNYDGYLVPVFDYSAQYPCINVGYNICISAWLTPKFIKDHGLIEGVHYEVYVLKNVYPVVKHACDKKCRMLEPKSQSIKDWGVGCKYDTEYKPVDYLVHIAKEEFFKGVNGEMATDLTKMREGYKKKKAEAWDKKEAAKDSDEYLYWNNLFDLYDSFQKSCKIRNNSLFGVTMRNNGLVGGLVPQLGRVQNQIVADHGQTKGYEVINADTDSVMMLDKDLALAPYPGDPHEHVKGPLTRLATKLIGPQEKNPRMSTVIKKLVEKYEKFADELNNGYTDEDGNKIPPAYPKPCKLEFEKVFTNQSFDRKKCYSGNKLEPNGKYVFHIAGMSGKKKDNTRVKAVTQFVGTKLVVERDYAGLIQFFRHVFDIVTTALRADEIGQLQADKICARIQPDIETVVIPPGYIDEDEIYVQSAMKTYVVKDLKEMQADSARARKEIIEFDKAQTQERIFKENHGDKLMDMKYMTSSEKTGNMVKMNTVASKRAVYNCRRKGEPLSQAASFTDVKRGSQVQVGSSIQTRLAILAESPIDELHQEMIDELERIYHKKTKESWEKVLDKRRRAKEAAEIENAKPKPLTITGMPARYCAKPETRGSIPKRMRNKLEKLLWRANFVAKIIKTEKDKQFAVKTYKPPAILDPENADELEWALGRINALLEGFKTDNDFFPMFWFDDTFAKGQWYQMADEEMDGWHVVPHDETCVNLWNLWLDGRGTMGDVIAVRSCDQNKRCAFKTFDSVDEILILHPDAIEHKHSDWSMIKTGKKDLMAQEDQIYYCNMKEYSMQTRSVPMVVVSCDRRKRVLINHDSYCRNVDDRFTFKVHKEHVMKMCRMNMFWWFSLRPIPDTCDVEVMVNGQPYSVWKDVDYVRGDGRDAPREGWIWDDMQEGVAVNAGDFAERTEEMRELMNTVYKNTEHMIISVDNTTGAFSIYPEDSPDEYKMSFKVGHNAAGTKNKAKFAKNPTYANSKLFETPAEAAAREVAMEIEKKSKATKRKATTAVKGPSAPKAKKKAAIGAANRALTSMGFFIKNTT